MQRKPPPRRMSLEQQKREVETAKQYYAAAQADLVGYHSRTDLIGRALLDLVKRAKTILEDAKRGIPFGHGRER